MDYLVGMLEVEEGNHEDLTAPLLVIASESTSAFRAKNINTYTYQASICMSSVIHNIHYIE